MIVRLKLWGTIFLMLILISVGFYVYHMRPLIRTSDIQVTAESKQYGAIGTTAYRVVGTPNIYFVQLESQLDGRYKWFVIDYNSKEILIPYHPEESPYLSYRHSASLGLSLSHPKHRKDWTVEWKEGGEVFFEGNRLVISARR